MSTFGSIAHAYQWDSLPGPGVDGHHIIGVSPTRDEVSLYQLPYNHKSFFKDSFAEPEKIRYRSGFSAIHCSAYSPVNKGIISVAQLNGSVLLFDINNPESQVVKLRSKQSRTCNALAFSDSGILAAGLEKTRNDNCLHLWDVNTVVEGGNISPLSTYLPNEIVSSLEFIPKTNNVLCGSYKLLREIDTRSGTPLYQCATRCTLGITSYPHKPNYFASYGEDGSLAIWDRRQLRQPGGNSSNEPMLLFPRLLSELPRKANATHLRYCTTRLGEMTVYGNTDSSVRRIDIGLAVRSDDDVYQNQQNNEPSSSTSQNRFFDFQKPPADPTAALDKYLFVRSSKDVEMPLDKLLGFDYIHSEPEKCPVEYICMRRTGQVFCFRPKESPEVLRFDPLNTLTFSNATNVFFESPSDEVREVDFKNQRESVVSIVSPDASSDEDEPSPRARNYSNDSQIGLMKLRDILDTDISTIIRKRALAGYGLDTPTNKFLLKSHNHSLWPAHLKNTWKWISRAQKADIDRSVVSEYFDLGYEGILDVWQGVQGLERQQNRLLKKDATESQFAQAIQLAMETEFTRKIYISASVAGTKKQFQRQLCLYVAGWDFSYDKLEAEIQKAEGKGEYEKAAGWAVFHGNVERAVQCLAASKKERHRIISTAISGYLSQSTNANSSWREQCRRLASELDNAYFRAIFAYIADGDWLDVLAESSLPLKERLGVALRFLPDDDLTSYLNRLGDQAVSRGELEGIILTGITPRAVDLLQSYVDRTGDIQTAALLTSFGAPRFFEDERYSQWVLSYQQLLNQWGMFKERALFDIARTKLSKNSTGAVTAVTKPRQVFLRCSYCNKNIFKDESKPGTGTSSTPSAKCPHCNSPLPRCAVCLLTMGEAMPDTRVELEKNNFAFQQFSHWFSFCLSCNHGMHAGHVQKWFSKHDVCPVPNCSCLCNSI
ncbi:SEH-associated protein 4 [Yarrowia sp. C11]|nr:SEH-associated protein 4 [Yarrowia sp. E02]KAG5367612.1 SEH-associated protein 4 [Yarrowia sp. C11]